MTDEEYAAYRLGRDERMKQMTKNMGRLIADDAEYPSLLKEHPLPWTWGVTYYDGVCIQFRDANGEPVLPGFIYDEELAAVVFKTITRGGYGKVAELAARNAELERVVRLLANAQCDVERANIATMARALIKH